MPMSAELQRKLDNIIRFGVIAEVNHATARARVKSGDILTDFTLRYISSGYNQNLVAADGGRTMYDAIGER